MPGFASLGRGVASAAAIIGLLSACAGPSAIYDKSQSHFDYPNSNVTTLGHVTATVSKSSMMFPAVGDPNLEQQAVRQALSEKGGDLLIDGRYFWTSTYIDILVPVFTTTLVVEGQAAKMELGHQVRAVPDAVR